MSDGNLYVSRVGVRDSSSPEIRKSPLGDGFNEPSPLPHGADLGSSTAASPGSCSCATSTACGDAGGAS